MPEFRTHYDNLKIKRTASNSTVRTAYKTLMQKYHPDKFDGTVQEALRITKIIQHSYEILIHPDKRTNHDRWIYEYEAKFKQKFGSTEFGITGKTKAQYFYSQSHDQNFYTEEELNKIAVNVLSSGMTLQRLMNKDYRIYYSGLMIAVAIALLFIGVSYRFSLLTAVSVILLFIQPVYIMYIIASRLINTFYE